jgi:hypothetical protein
VKTAGPVLVLLGVLAGPLSAGPIQMTRVATVPGMASVLSAPAGLDFDHDGQREFVMRMGTAGAFGGRLEFYESTGDDSFALVHVLDLTVGETSAFHPEDSGDGDGDGRAELLVRGKIGNEYFNRLYESRSPQGYAEDLVWEVENGFGWSQGVLLADTDADGKQEIVIGGTAVGRTGLEERTAIYENDGDDSYVETYYHEMFGSGVSQSLEVARDLDQDGRDEILYGANVSPNGVIFAIESTGDDAYEVVWTFVGAPPANVSFIIDGGDLDGDGKKEFLAGGATGTGQCTLLVFEAVSDNDFQIVASMSLSQGTGFPAATVADVDGDGRREIVFGVGDQIAIYENTGDNAWHKIWTGTTCTSAGCFQSVGAGDHDADGKEEIIFRENSFTGVWEIHPADAADMDGDGSVDVIDNCPSTGNPWQQDADADAVGDACDNCVYGPNPAQGPAVFGQAVLALDEETFSWPNPADIVYVRGALDLVGSYAVDLVLSLPLASQLTDSSVPPVGEGSYYLVKTDCPVGSWQSELGAEPGRDAALP